MKYRGIEYSVVQGIGRHVWKWSISLDTGASVGGRTAIKSEAVAEPERTMDRALAPKKQRLGPPKTERCCRAAGRLARARNTFKRLWRPLSLGRVPNRLRRAGTLA